ncbi:MAG TPA: NfeD family protein [Anaerolineae bacterium]|nr:NfeD family protein [Anaerolineae bacterium]
MFESGLSALNCIYFFLFFLGVGYAVYIAITGGLGGGGDVPAGDVDIPQIDVPGGADIGGGDLLPASIDAPDVSVSPLSPITIATFVTVFGGLGVITLQFLKIDPRWSLLIAAGGALLGSGLMFLLYSRVLIGSQASSQVQRRELIGLEAEVSVPIGEMSPGQVSYITKAGRMISIARSIDGQPIPRGQFVKIVRVMGPQVLVRPAAPQDEKPEEEGGR